MYGLSETCMEIEKLLHYTWKHRLYPLRQLVTSDDRVVEVIDPGVYNRLDAGPDFSNAKIKVDGTVWAGNVEMHIKSSDWYRHHHDKDEAYNNVILHVVTVADMDVVTQSGRMPAQLMLPISPRLKDDYEHLLQSDKYPPCYKRIPEIPSLKIHSWLAALQVERLQRKTIDIEDRVERSHGSWEDAYFQTLARNFGFGINGEAFEVWARSLELSKLAHHRDDLFQIEAMFLGQASLLHKVDEKYAREYEYLKHKFGLEPMDGALWRYLRTRPQNFPHVRLLQLAKMYHEQRTGLSQLLACESVKDISKLFDIKGNKLALLIINTAVPIIFAYGKTKEKERFCEKAFNLLDELKAEDNHIVRMWEECGLCVRSAGDSQALIQLKNEYCDRKECLRCRIGFEYFKFKMDN